MLVQISLDTKWCSLQQRFGGTGSTHEYSGYTIQDQQRYAERQLPFHMNCKMLIVDPSQDCLFDIGHHLFMLKGDHLFMRTAKCCLSITPLVLIGMRDNCYSGH